MRQKNYAWREPWNLHVTPIPITDTLYYVGNRDVSCHLIKTPDGAILLDTAFANTSYLLIESLYRIGVRPEDVKLIVHSHGHEDHCGATRRVQALSGAQVYLGEDDVGTVQKGTPLTCADYVYGIKHFETFTVDHPVRHGDVIEFGGVAIHCHHTPGHTAGTVSYTFDVEVDGRAYCAGIFGGPGMWTLEDESRDEQGYPANREDFRRSLDYLSKLDIEVWLGAHPDQSHTFEKAERLARGERPNPFVDPEGWKAFIEGISKRYRERFG